MKPILFLLSLILTFHHAFAETKLSLVGSLLYTSPDTNKIKNSTVTDEQSDLSFGLGMRALMALRDQLHFRSGAGVISKKFSYQAQSTSAKVDNDFSLIYLNLPLTLYWKASSQIGLFGGTALNAKLSDDCHASGSGQTCTQNKVNAVVFPAIVGFDFSLVDKVGIELTYEYGMTETAKDLRVHSAVMSLLFHLE